MKKIRLFKYPLVKQYDQKDCGAASLLSVLKYYGGDSGFPKIRELCNTNVNGSTMLDVVVAAKKLGFDANGAAGEFDDLLKEKMPCIAHLVLENGFQHFVVIYKIKKDKIYLADPGKGKYWLSKEEFLKLWKTKSVVLLTPTENIYYDKAYNWYNWLYEYLKKDESWVYETLFLGIIYSLLSMVTAVIIKLLLDKFIPGNEQSKIIISGSGLLLIFSIRAVVGYLRLRFLVILNYNVSNNINTDFIERLFRLSKKFFDTRKIGDITARVNDAIRIQNSILKILSSTIIDILIVVLSLSFVFYFSANLAGLSILFVCIYSLLLVLNIKKIREQQTEVMKSYALVEANYVDNLKGIDEIMSYNVNKSFVKINKAYFKNYQEKIKSIGLIKSNLSFFSEFANGLLSVVVLILGSIWVTDGIFMIGELMAAFALISNTIPAINRLADTPIVLQEASIASRRLLDIILIDIEKNTCHLPFKMESALEIKNGFFSWNNRDYLLKNINIQISKGKLTTFWGRSGIGKSTIVQILQRKYALNEGSVLLDDMDVSEIDLFEYRENIAVVPQDIKIFNGTIAENITLYREVEFEKLTRRIDELGLMSFFKRFDYGLFTIIGEEGRLLSGGEKQIISLTRALLNTPEILILDEGLSGLDAELELLIFNVIKKYSEKHAVLLITHNMNKIMKTDYLYIFDNGTISKQGEPEEIFKTDKILSEF